MPYDSIIIFPMAKFYSRSGDDGFTGLLGEGRVPKYHPRPETVGAIDEATAVLGMARSICQAEQSSPLLLAIQRDLYHIMSEIAATPERAHQFRVINSDRVKWLEEQTDAVTTLVEMPKDFILPGDSPSGAMLAIARTVIRRAERLVARLLHEGEIKNIELLRYFNRLSSFCFVLELLENKYAGNLSHTLAKDNPDNEPP